MEFPDRLIWGFPFAGRSDHASGAVRTATIQSGFLMQKNHRSRTGVTTEARRLFRFTLLSRTVWLRGFGLGLIIMTVLIGGAAFNTGTNLLYVMLSLLIAIETLSIASGWVNLNGLSANRIVPAECHAGKPTEIQVVLQNRKRWMASYGIAVEENVPDAEPSPLGTYFLAIPPRGTAVERQPVTFRRRGIYRLEGVRLGTLFPFGVLEFRSRQADPVEIIVFPEIVRVDPPRRLLTRGAGDQEHPEKGHGSGLYSIREYMAGDPARNIHWRSSAKGGGLKIIEYESESTEGIQLVLDINRPELRTPDDHERLEKAISITASLARHYLANEIEVMLWTAAGSVPRGTGPTHLKRLLRSLALLKIEDLNPHLSPPLPPADMAQVRVSGHGTETAMLDQHEFSIGAEPAARSIPGSP